MRNSLAAGPDYRIQRLNVVHTSPRKGIWGRSDFTGEVWFVEDSSEFAASIAIPDLASTLLEDKGEPWSENRKKIMSRLSLDNKNFLKRIMLDAMLKERGLTFKEALERHVG